MRDKEPLSLLLTPRQREIALLLAEGRTQRAIARQLGLSPRTVEGHTRAARARTGAGSTIDLALQVATHASEEAK